MSYQQIAPVASDIAWYKYVNDGSQKNISGHAVYSIDYGPSFLITACFIHPATGKLQM